MNGSREEGRMISFLLLLATRSVWSSIIVTKHNRAINLNPKLGKWPGKEIPYYIDPAYTDEEEGQIRLAMLRVMSDLDMCVRFTEVAPESPVYKLKVTPIDTSSTLNATFSKLCHTFAGTYLAGMAQGKTEQLLLLTTGPEGCFDGSMHSLMKYFAVSLGLRNEHQRPDRDGYLQISNEKIDPQLQVAYQTYPAAEVHITCPYDYCSITHNQPTDFASVNGTEIFTVKEAPYFIPKLDQLSTCDCQQLKALYGCDPASCQILDCASQVRKPSTLQPTSTTKAAMGRDDEAQATTLCYSVPPGMMNGSNSSTLTTLSPGATSPMTTQSTATTTCTVTTKLVPAAPQPDPPGASTTTTAKPGRRKRESHSKALRVINSDQNYLKWSQNTVPYFIDPSYTASQRGMIQQAIRKVMVDLNGCVQFSEVPPSASTYKIHIAPVDDSPNPKRGCHTLPGVSKHLVSTGSTEQKLILTSGPGGCFDGNIGTIMKYFVLVLGRRNEHQRPDRDNYIEVLRENISPGMEMAYEKYTVDNVSMPTYPYDYCSITHNDLSDFATSGRPAFVIKNSAVSSIPKLDRLSEYDCKEICNTYGCDSSTCTPLDCPQASALNRPPMQFPVQLTSGNFGATDIPVTVSPTADGGATVCMSMPDHAVGSSTTIITNLDMSFRQEVPPGSDDATGGSKSDSLTGTASVTCTTDSGSATTPSVLASLLNQMNNHHPPNKNEVFQTLEAMIKQMEAQIGKGGSTGSTVAPGSGAITSGTTSSTVTGSGKPSSGPNTGSSGKPNFALLSQHVKDIITALQAQMNGGTNTSSSSGSTPSSTSTAGSTTSPDGIASGASSGATVASSTVSDSTTTAVTTTTSTGSSQSSSPSTTTGLTTTTQNLTRGDALDDLPADPADPTNIPPPPPEQSGRHDGLLTAATDITFPADDYDYNNLDREPTIPAVATTDSSVSSSVPNWGPADSGSPPPAVLFDEITELPSTSQTPEVTGSTTVMGSTAGSSFSMTPPLISSTSSSADGPALTETSSVASVASSPMSSVNEIPSTITTVISTGTSDISAAEASFSPEVTSADAPASSSAGTSAVAVTSSVASMTTVSTQSSSTTSPTQSTPDIPTTESSQPATTSLPTATTSTTQSSVLPSSSPTPTFLSTSATEQPTSSTVTTTPTTGTPLISSASTAVPATSSATPVTTESTTTERVTETTASSSTTMSTNLSTWLPSTADPSTSTTSATTVSPTTVLITTHQLTTEPTTTHLPTTTTILTTATSATSTTSSSSSSSTQPPPTVTTKEISTLATSGSTEEPTTTHLAVLSHISSPASSLPSTTRPHLSSSRHSRSTTRHGSTFGRTSSHRPGFFNTTKLSLHQMESNLHEILSGIQLPGAGANGTSSSGTATTKSLQQVQAALHNMIVQLGSMTGRTNRPLGTTLTPGSKPTHSAAYLNMQASLDEMIKKLEEESKKRTTTQRTTSHHSTTESPPPPPPPPFMR